MSGRVMIVDSPPYLKLKGHRDKIHRVIYNLVSTAIKFSAKDTTIDITIHEKDSHANVCIQDYGRVIPKESV